MTWLEEVKARCEKTPTGEEWRADVLEEYYFHYAFSDEIQEFIAHARTDLPRAIELLEEARILIRDYADMDILDANRGFDLKDWESPVTHALAEDAMRREEQGEKP